MQIFFIRFTSLILIFNLLWARGFFLGEVLAQSDLPPTSTPAPTTPPDPPKPTNPPKPTSPPLNQSEPSPTNMPQPTTPPQPPAGEASHSSSPIEAFSDASSLTPTPTGSLNDSSDQSESTTNEESNDSPEGSSSATSLNDPANTNTGPFSENNASEVLAQKYEVLNKNLAQLQNQIEIISSSGFNYANLNTLEGQVFTGDALTTFNLLNKLNSNMTGVGGFSVFNIYDTYLGDIIFKFIESNTSDSFAQVPPMVVKNSVTGPFSTNNALSDSSFVVKEVNGNDTKLTNDINLQAITGSNSTSFNTGGGEIKTGNATAVGNIVNLANTNLNVSKWLFGVINIFGTLAGNIVLPKEEPENSQQNLTPGVISENGSTGPGSINNASYNYQSTAEFESNNTADITSNLNVSANTGNNTASNNTGGGRVTTGSSSTSISNTTIANSNTIEEEGTVWMVIVNEAGKWIGKILGAPWGSTIASNSLPMSQTVTSDNTNTGPFSTNSATYENTLDTSIMGEDEAAIENNITVVADTGNNQAEYNTGAGKIETGEAEVGLNLVNMANTKVVAQKFVAVLVNILGTFLGNVVPPDQQIADSTLGSHLGGSPDNNLPLQPTPTPIVASLPSFSTPAADIEGMMVYESEPERDNSSVTSDQGDDRPSSLATTQERRKKVNSSKLRRGIFLSPAFAKATETTFPGILLDGRSLRISESWLSVIPLAFLIIFLRRKRLNLNIGSYLNTFLEMIL